MGALSNQDHGHSVRFARSAIAEDAQTLYVTGKMYIIVGIINGLNITPICCNFSFRGNK